MAKGMETERNRCSGVAAGVALVAVLSGAGARAAAATGEERWFELRFHGHKVGSVVEHDEDVLVGGRPAVHVRRVTTITVRRARDTIHMEHAVDAWFRLDGTPLRYRMRRLEGGELRTGRGERIGDRFVIEHTVGGSTKRREFELRPGDRLALSLEKLLLRNPKAGVRARGRVIEETEGAVQDYQISIGEPEDGRYPVVEEVGGIRSALVAVPGQGVVRSELVGAGIVMERASREQARRLERSVDIFRAAMFEIPDDLPPRSELDGLVVRFARDEGEPPTVGSFDGQTVEAGDGYVEVTTRRREPPTTADRLPERTDALAPYLAGTDYEDLEDPQLIATAQREVGDAKDPWTAARRLNAFVNRHIDEKTLAHAYASASEALSSRSGDCTEHAVLFSALAKIVGIPTRLATGLVYVGGARPSFGYHEWVEVHIGGRWHPMDPTFGQDTADATHIKFSEGLSDPEGLRKAGLAAASLIRGVRVSVVAATVDGKRRDLR